MIKKAMIMAAGVGSRLGALCSVVPKPLAPLANIPAIDIILEHLAASGIKDVIANTFYKAEDIQKHCRHNKFGVNFSYIQEKELSGTAGGLSKCRHFFEDADDFIVMSGDGLSDVNIEKAYYSFKASNAIAAIVTKEVHHREVSKYGIIVPDKEGFVKSFQEKPKIDEALSNLANTGIYLFKREIFDYIPENKFYDFAKDVFPLLMKNGRKVYTFNHNGYWSDIGSLEQYIQSNADILNGKIPYLHPDIIYTESGRYIKGENSIADKDADIQGCCVIGNGCRIEKNTSVKNSILWDNVIVKQGAVVENAVILPDTAVSDGVFSGVVSKPQESMPQKKIVFL